MSMAQRDRPGEPAISFVAVHSGRRRNPQRSQHGRRVGLRLALTFARQGALDNAAVRTERLQVAGLVQKPDAFPSIENRSQIFRGENQLPRAANRIGRIDRNDATKRRSQRAAEQNGQKKSSHCLFSSLKKAAFASGVSLGWNLRNASSLQPPRRVPGSRLVGLFNMSSGDLLRGPFAIV